MPFRRKLRTRNQYEMNVLDSGLRRNHNICKLTLSCILKRVRPCARILEHSRLRTSTAGDVFVIAGVADSTTSPPDVLERRSTDGQGGASDIQSFTHPFADGVSFINQVCHGGRERDDSNHQFVQYTYLSLLRAEQCRFTRTDNVFHPVIPPFEYRHSPLIGIKRA